MNYLVGDIGNTNIKICKIDKKFRIKNTYLFNSKSSNLKKELTTKIKNINEKNFNKKVLFSSVVPQVFNKIKLILKKKKMKVYEIKNFNLKNMMKFNIKKYSQLGSDRIANSVGAYSKFKSNYPMLWLISVIIKNLIGYTLIIGGMLMLVLPGQGLFTILIGLMLSNYPGKFYIEKKFIAIPSILKTINWLRKKSNKPPLKI